MNKYFHEPTRPPSKPLTGSFQSITCDSIHSISSRPTEASTCEHAKFSQRNHNPNEDRWIAPQSWYHTTTRMAQVTWLNYRRLHKLYDPIKRHTLFINLSTFESDSWQLFGSNITTWLNIGMLSACCPAPLRRHLARKLVASWQLIYKIVQLVVPAPIWWP